MIGSLRLNHTGSARGTTLVANSDNRLRLVSDSDARLRSIIATLEKSRAELAESINPEAAQILAVAILQLQMRLHGVADTELTALCHVLEAERSKKSDGPTSKAGGFTGGGSHRPN
jgi:hypothetical protein